MELVGQHETAQDFAAVCRSFSRWTSERMDFVGGWLPEIEDIYTQKTFGYFAYTRGELEQFEAIADRAAATYRRIAESGSVVVDEAMTDAQRTVLEESAQSAGPSPTTLRVDVVLDRDGRAYVVEVNSDNVAGLENLFLYHEFALASGAAKEVEADVRASLSRLLASYRGWLGAHYARFRAMDPSRPSIEEAEVVVAYDDRDHCFFIARVLPELLRAVGLQASVLRPENLHVSTEALLHERPFDSSMRQVDILLKHWMFFEQFDEAGALRPRFRSAIEADRAELALVLNPIKDRRLFSKGILAQILAGSLPDAGRLGEYCVPTQLVDLNGRVLKPLSQFGGSGVIVGGAGDWLVVQERVDSEPIESWYIDGGEPERVSLTAVHGLLVYVSPEGAGSLAGIMGRAGPNTVVNFSRGAQVFGTLTP